MPDFASDVTLTVRGPVIQRSSVPVAWGVGTPFSRNLEGRAVIPWSEIKGLLLDAWKDLLALDPSFITRERIEVLLGKGTGTDEETPARGTPFRGRLRGLDFAMSRDPKEGIIYRIVIDEERRAAETGMYQVVESPLGRGEEGAFQGRIRFEASTAEEAKDIHRFLDKGLKWIRAVGGLRSVGFGSLARVVVGSPMPAAVQTPRTTPGAGSQTGRFWIALALDRPLLVSRSQPNRNAFEASDEIPGAVLKGALAATWADRMAHPLGSEVDQQFDKSRPELSKHFWSVRFGHAFPSRAAEPEKSQRPVRVPLSTVAVKGRKELLDVSLAEGACLIDGFSPAFSVDWKEPDETKARTTFGWPSLERSLTVRTAIDPGKGTALEGKLFAYEPIETAGLVWLSEVDLSGIDDDKQRREAERQLRELLDGGLRFIGKTKAETTALAVVEEQPAAFIAERPIVAGEPLVITLQSDALILDGRQLAEATDQAGLFEKYAAYWREVCGGLSLVRFFARQKLAGGWYMHRRFSEAASYHPWVLTDAGSVFVLSSSGETGDLVKALRRKGLPIPKSISSGVEPSLLWKQCPFVPENGYGAVAVNLKFHFEKGRRADLQTPGFILIGKEVSK